MSRFRITAVVAVSLIFTLSGSEAEPGDSSPGTPGFSNSPSFKASPESRRGSPAAGGTRGSKMYDLAFKCKTGCNAFYGHVLDETGKKIYVMRLKEQTSCSCDIAKSFIRYVQKHQKRLEPIPRGTLCVSMVRNTKCLCRHATKLQQYLVRNHLEGRNRVCELNLDCQCIISTRFINYLRSENINIQTFISLFAANEDQAYEWLAANGVKVIKF